MIESTQLLKLEVYFLKKMVFIQKESFENKLKKESYMEYLEGKRIIVSDAIEIIDVLKKEAKYYENRKNK